MSEKNSEDKIQTEVDDLTQISMKSTGSDMSVATNPLESFSAFIFVTLAVYIFVLLYESSNDFNKICLAVNNDLAFLAKILKDIYSQLVELLKGIPN